ncbi:MAG: hypothetical protein LC808_33770 [Actinobacteria bacterium]|nr:hypothetical protein [Actinomycetota bacterium]
MTKAGSAAGVPRRRAMAVREVLTDARRGHRGLFWFSATMAVLAWMLAKLDTPPGRGLRLAGWVVVDASMIEMLITVG